MGEEDLGLGQDCRRRGRRLADLGATLVAVLAEPGLDHYGVAMKDPESNEFDINGRPEVASGCPVAAGGS